MRKLTSREKRLLIYFGIFLAVMAWDTARRHWSPDITIRTEHYIVYSTATAEQTREIATVAEVLYAGYMPFLDQLGVSPGSHEKLRIKLFKDRDEFRLCNRVRGWAEALYREPYCYQYYSAKEANPYHWMVHEATHQLNEEVAGLSLAKWLNEGIAEYFGTSRIVDNRLRLGDIDTNTYPVWWLGTMATAHDFESDQANGSIISLRAIVSGSGGPDMDEFFNLYYLHWWSLTHFLLHYENGRYRGSVAHLINSDCDVKAFEKYVGDINTIERQLYQYVLDLKLELSGSGTPPVVIEGISDKSEQADASKE